MAACDHCHRRKVACDSSSRSACSRCQKRQIECSFYRADEVADRSKLSKSQREANHVVRRRGKLLLQRNSLVERSKHRANSLTATSTTQQSQSHSWESVVLTSDVYNASSKDVEKGKVQGDAVPRDDSELARSGLADFFEGADSNEEVPWSKAGRFAYIGTGVSNLAHLMSNQTATPECLHYPHPAIRMSLPPLPNGLSTVHGSDATVYGGRERAFSRSYLTTFDAGYLPDRVTCDALIEAYFTKVNPGYPVVHESDFRSRIRAYFDNNDAQQDCKRAALLLFQSVLLAGTRVCDKSAIVRSRTKLRTALYRRAKALFDLRYENDRNHLVQAALLLSLHADGADDVSANAYYWSGTAARIAMGLGMHRRSLYSTLPTFDRREYQRIWWVVVQTEVWCSLNYGRPFTIDLDECDADFPVEDSFRTTEHVETNPPRPAPTTQTSFCVHNTSLCLIIIEILKLFTPGSILKLHGMDSTEMQSAKTCLNSKLASWFMSLPPGLNNCTRAQDHFWTAQLHLNYYTAILALNRRLLFSRLVAATHASLSASANNAGNTVCGGAASSIAALFDDIMSSNSITQCSFTAVTASLAAVIQINNEIQYALNLHPTTTVLALDSLSKFERFFPILTALGEQWPYAEGILRLCKGIKDKTSAQISASLLSLPPNPSDYQSTRESQGMMTSVDVDTEMTWPDVFGMDLTGQGLTGIDCAEPMSRGWLQLESDITQKLF